MYKEYQETPKDAVLYQIDTRNSEHFDDSGHIYRFDSVGEKDLFGPEHALQIIRFVDTQIRSGVNKFLIHCQAGYSRSPAIAAALEKILNGNHSEVIDTYYAQMYPDSMHDIAGLYTEPTDKIEMFTSFYENGDDSGYFDSGKYSPNMRVYKTLLNIGQNYHWFSSIY